MIQLLYVVSYDIGWWYRSHLDSQHWD